MIDSAVLLLLNGLLLMLRISPGDSFPRPLSAADEALRRIERGELFGKIVLTV